MGWTPRSTSACLHHYLIFQARGFIRPHTMAGTHFRLELVTQTTELHTHAHTYTRTDRQTDRHTHTHTRARAHTHTHTHTHTHMHTHTHTHSWTDRQTDTDTHTTYLDAWTDVVLHLQHLLGQSSVSCVLCDHINRLGRCKFVTVRGTLKPSTRQASLLEFDHEPQHIGRRFPFCISVM